jgi:hypothetical protein
MDEGTDRRSFASPLSDEIGGGRCLQPSFSSPSDEIADVLRR